MRNRLSDLYSSRKWLKSKCDSTGGGVVKSGKLLTNLISWHVGSINWMTVTSVCLLLMSVMFYFLIFILNPFVITANDTTRTLDLFGSVTIWDTV